MAETLYAVDLSLFYVVNHSLQNMVFDVLMPVLTDLNKKPVVLGAVFIAWLWLMIRGGAQGRMAGILLVITIAFSDQLNSSWVKHLFERTRPCHVLSDVRLLVDCGSGYSFPSSHAVNNFAAALVLSSVYRRWTWVFFTFASLVALTRVYVGVHYPSDVLAGAVLGVVCGALVVVVVRRIVTQWEQRLKRPESES